jgi:hypothetical protein
MEWGRKNLKNDNDDLFFVGAGENSKATQKEIVEAVSYDLVMIFKAVFIVTDAAINKVGVFVSANYPCWEPPARWLPPVNPAYFLSPSPSFAAK